MMKRAIVAAFAGAVLMLSAGAHAQQGMGMGMMCDEQGAADGDMHMMGPGMGAGMMGHGMGMMAGHGMGMGFRMSPAAMQMLGLSPEQKTKISQIQAQARKKQWQVMGDLREERFKLHELMSSATAPDPAAATAQYQKVQDLERQLFEGALLARSQVEATLTPEQKEKLKSAVMGPGMGGRQMGPMHQ
ncbi:MAG TPA: Spy/CpxP family protein refolding chaperone [Burkholderiales bacterium]|nr:Spy/CpxP family protein refolding chaperone [Burkholderiales bacterium]